MQFRQAIPATLMPVALMLAGCSPPTPPPCPDTAPRETAVLLVSTFPSNHGASLYQLDFATMAACEVARQELHAEMDRMIERAKATDFNQSTQAGSTDTRNRYYAPYMRPAVHSYSDATAVCAAHAIGTPPQGQPIPTLQQTLADKPH